MRNEIDEDYMDVHMEMKDNVSQVLLKLIEENNPRKLRDSIVQIYQQMRAETIPKEIVTKVIQVLYVEESLLKTAILDRVDAEITREISKQHGQSGKKSEEERRSQGAHQVRYI